MLSYFIVISNKCILLGKVRENELQMVQSHCLQGLEEATDTEGAGSSLVRL